MGELFAFLAKSSVTDPLARIGGEHCERYSRLLKKSFSLGSRNPAAEKDCFTSAELGLLVSVLFSTSSHMEDALVVLPKDGPGPPQGKSVPVGISPSYFYQEQNLTPPESTRAGQRLHFVSGERAYLRERTLCPSTWRLQHPRKCLIAEPRSLPPIFILLFTSLNCLNILVIILGCFDLKELKPFFSDKADRCFD